MDESFTGSKASVEARLARLEAEGEIVRLKNRYFHAGDLGDMTALRDCFTDDARIEFPGLSCGPDELHAIFVAQRAAYPGFFVHCGYNPRIEVIDATHARGEWDLCFVSLMVDRTQSTSFGRYQDEYRLTEKGWRISACRSETRVTFTAQLAEGIRIEGGDPSLFS